MLILLNGVATPVAAPCTISRLLADLALVERKVAVEVNGSIVARSAHDLHALREGDRIEIVHALGGG